LADQETPKKLGRYEIVRELGKGAMGVVYEGRDPNIGRRVAIKTARRDVMAASTMADEMMKRFLREAQAAGALNHPNIITIYDADEEGGMAYIAMEFLEGHDLRKTIEDRNRFSVEDIARMGATICEALAAAHDQGIVHRDIKPANVLMLPNGHLKIADFGIAHVSDSNLTQDGAMIGTPHYMSPEQFMGQKVDGRADLFSVAVMLYELLTGEKPFSGEALSTVMHKVIKTDPVPLQELNYAVPDALNRVIMKALHKRPQERYPDGRVMAAALLESVKAMPNPAVLMLEEQTTIDSEKTVMAGVTPAASMGATVPGSAPAPVAGTTATTVSQGPPPAVGAAAPVPAPPKKGVPKAVWAGGVAVLVLTVMVLGIMRSSGRTTPAASPEPPKVTTGTVNAGKDLVAAPPPSLQETAKVLVEVYAAQDTLTYTDIDAARLARESTAPDAPDPLTAKAAELEGKEQIKRLAGVKVTVVDDATKQTLETGTTDGDGQVLLKIPANLKSVSYKLEGVVNGKPVERTLTENKNPLRAQVFALY